MDFEDAFTMAVAKLLDIDLTAPPKYLPTAADLDAVAEEQRVKEITGAVPE